MTPTARRTIQEFTQSDETRSVWFVAAGPSSTKPGRYPFNSVVVHPARATAVATPNGRATQRRRRFEGTMHLSDCGQGTPKSRATSHLIHANRAGWRGS